MWAKIGTLVKMVKSMILLELLQIFYQTFGYNFCFAFGSFMIVLAELWRAFIITTECHSYQDQVKKIINNIKEEKGKVDEKKKNVSNLWCAIQEYASGIYIFKSNSKNINNNISWKSSTETSYNDLLQVSLAHCQM